MKFVKFMLCIIAIICMIQETKTQIKERTKLLALGDVGQVEPWFKQNIKLKIASKIPFDRESFDFANIYSTRIAKEMAAETVYISDKKKHSEIFSHFAELYTCGIDKNGWDRTVILGDAVYSEHKGGLLKASFGQVYTSKEIDLPETQIVGKKRKFYMVAKEVTELSQIYDRRVDYASKKLFELLKKGNRKEDSCKAEEIEILPGNHSFDVDAKLETEASAKYSKNLSNVIRWKYPFWSNELIFKGSAKVNFLDINLMAMVCLDESFKVGAINEKQIYRNCILDSTNAGSSYLFDVAQARNYLLKLIGRLVQSKIFGQLYDWRVMRTHNPILNPEIDFNTLLLMKVKVRCFDFENKKFKYDMNTIWATDKITSGSLVTCEFDESAPEVTLMEIFRRSEIDFWLASHYHAAMVVAAPFNRTFFKSKYQGTFLNLEKPDHCIDRFDEFFKKVDRQATIPHPGAASETTLKPCKDDKTEKVIELLPKGPQNLLIEFIIGNSGRVLDPLKSDKLSNGDIIWARSKAERYMDNFIDDAKKVSPADMMNQKKFDDKVEELAANAFAGYGNRFGYAFITFEKTQAFVEFRETALHTVVQKFKLVRRKDDKNVHKIERILTKTKPSKFFFKK